MKIDYLKISNIRRGYTFSPSRYLSDAKTAINNLNEPRIHCKILTNENILGAYKNEKTSDLIRALFMLSSCRSTFLLKNNDKILKNSRMVFGKHLFEFGIKQSIYKQFIGGDTDNEVLNTLIKLNNKNVGSILDYAVEKDIENTLFDNEKKEENVSTISDAFLNKNFDPNTDNYYLLLNSYLTSISLSALDKKASFIAIKLTSLCNTSELKLFNQAITNLKRMFKEQSNENNLIDFDGFNNFFLKLGISVENQVLSELFISDGRKDSKYMGWHEFHSLIYSQNLRNAIKSSDNEKSVVDKLFSNVNLLEIAQMIHRIDYICQKCKENNVKIMVDAEQTYFQEAIHFITLNLQSSYNKEKTVVYNTHQAYLKNAFNTLKEDIYYGSNHKNPFIIGSKVVRGAYANKERELASKNGYQSPICDTYEDTNIMFAQCRNYLVESAYKNTSSVIVATHNMNSVKATIKLINDYSVSNFSENIHFAQLLGMCDYITNVLAKNNLSVFKYVPYGPVEETLPYLSRRIAENQSVLTRAAFESDLIKNELKKRMLRSKGPSSSDNNVVKKHSTTFFM